MNALNSIMEPLKRVYLKFGLVDYLDLVQQFIDASYAVVMYVIEAVISDLFMAVYEGLFDG